MKAAQVRIQVRDTMQIQTKSTVILLIAGLAIWFFFWRSPRHDYANYPPPHPGPWVAFGDSLTEGYGASLGNDYPALLGKLLNRQIINLGQSGDTTTDGLQRLDSVLQLNPRVVLLCLGGNDTLQNAPTESMLANLSTIIDRLQGQGAFVVFIGVRSASLRDRNERLFRQLAEEKKTFYIPNILKGIFPKPIYMSDAMHPNDQGYQRIAERLARELRPLLDALN